LSTCWLGGTEQRHRLDICQGVEQLVHDHAGNAATTIVGVHDDIVDVGVESTVRYGACESDQLTVVPGTGGGSFAEHVSDVFDATVRPPIGMVVEVSHCFRRYPPC